MIELLRHDAEVSVSLGGGEYFPASALLAVFVDRDEYRERALAAEARCRALGEAIGELLEVGL